ncbi:MAG: hypothetical protein IPG57_25515 [Burkholderiales bacterium]|nr:hypothetical protein [Burkholderiales bacterium]MBP7522920.1 hypothetical protein [Leptothrix sp. (in: b-proteobacteria)]HQY10278.1 hypothetical protein [Burkholderiaceae bacterium]
METEQVIHIHPGAPPKPAPGQPCNGCGICCLVEPCPLGVLLSARRHGACRALVWDDGTQRYLCGALLGQPQALPPPLRLLRLPLQLVARRLIAAGIGCDCELDVQFLTTPPPSR